MNLKALQRMKRNMTTRQEITEVIITEKLVAIIRLKNTSSVQMSLDCLVKGGVKVLELTSTTPDYCEHIRVACKKYPHLLIGAGTILNQAMAEEALNAGAQFLVTPNVNDEVAKVAHANNVPVIMGALTPTEIVQAVKCNADILKIFPAGSMGINYCKALRDPFPEVPMFAVGGIELLNAGKWLKAGMQGVGLGGELVQEITSDVDIEKHVQRVKNFLADRLTTYHRNFY